MKKVKKLVKVLLGQHNHPEYVCRFPWQEGSIAFWDNRAVQHYPASNYYPRGTDPPDYPTPAEVKIPDAASLG